MGGAKVPLVPRSTGESWDGIAKVRFIGTVYVHGFMDGLARSWMQEGKLQEKSFILVRAANSNWVRLAETSRPLIQHIVRVAIKYMHSTQCAGFRTFCNVTPKVRDDQGT